MKDINGIEMKTGMVVEIENAFFKNDNGLWFITESAGDANWTGVDHCLHKLCKNGKVSTARHHIAFWPLVSFCSDSTKNYDAKQHNEQFATIKVRTDINMDGIREYFAEKAEGAQSTLDWHTRMGHAPKVIDMDRAIVEHYAGVIQSI